MDEVMAGKQSSFQAPTVDFPADVLGRRAKGCIDLCWPILFLSNAGAALFLVASIAGKLWHDLRVQLAPIESARLGSPANALESLVPLLLVAVVVAHCTVLFFVGLQSAGPSWALGLVLAVSCKILLGTGMALLWAGSIYGGIALCILFGLLLAYVCSKWVSLRLTADLGLVVKKSMQGSPGMVPLVGLVILYPGLLLVLGTAIVLADSFVSGRLPHSFVHHEHPVHILYLGVVAYWTLGVLGNLVYALSAGTVQRWYYAQGSGAAGCALRQVLGHSSGAVCFAAFIRGPVGVFRALGWLCALGQHGRHDLGNEKAAQLLTQCCGGCMRSRKPASLMFLGRESLAFVMLKGEDLCTAAHLMATHRYGSGFQDIADSNLNHHLAGVVAMLYNGVAAGLLTFGLLSLSSLSLLVKEADSLGGGRDVDIGFLHIFAAHSWSAKAFVSAVAAISAAFLVHIASFLEGGSAGLIAAWSEDTAALERAAPHLHDKLRMHVLAYGGDGRREEGKEVIYSSDEDEKLRKGKWRSGGSLFSHDAAGSDGSEE